MFIRMPIAAALLAATALLSTTAYAGHPDGDEPHGAHSHAHDHAGKATAVLRADGAEASRTVEVTLGDLYVQPETLSVKAGETVRFVVRNDGSLLHAFEIGTPAQQAEAQAHTAMMLDHGMVSDTTVNASMMKMDHGDGGHDMGHAAMATLLVEPGATAEGTWTFAEATTLELACSMPGHYEAGMASRLDVAR